jgi:hypothetical protein
MDQYSDDLDKIEVFPQGKVFRVLYDGVMRCLRVVARTRDAFEELRNVFSVENKSAFFSQQYGYRGEPRLYNINKFGFFLPGLVYDILQWIKTQYGTLNVVAISKNCSRYLSDELKPLRSRLSSRFELSNIANDSGVNRSRD